MRLEKWLLWAACAWAVSGCPEDGAVPGAATNMQGAAGEMAAPPPAAATTMAPLPAAGAMAIGPAGSGASGSMALSPSRSTPTSTPTMNTGGMAAAAMPTSAMPSPAMQAPDAGVAAPDAGMPATPSMPSGACDYMQAMKLTADLVVPSGKTVRMCAGTALTAAKGIKVDVLGELIVEGSAASPVTFLGGGQPSSWHGIVIEKGGTLKLTHAKIGDAEYGIYALPGSDFAVDSSVIGTSFKAAIIQSNGTFTRTRFEATTPPTISLASEVSVDDPNGTLTILDASPKITNCTFESQSIFTDMVRIGGMSSPTFDHVTLRGAHCGFHTFGGTNTSARITNAVFEGLAYGIMAYTTKPIVENSVFKDNGTDIGLCNGATADNAPVLRNNNYSAGSPTIDASCFRIGTTDAMPAATPNPSAGPTEM